MQGNAGRTWSILWRLWHGGPLQLALMQHPPSYLSKLGGQGSLGGGETYLESEDWDGNENWRYRQTDRQTDNTAIQIEVMHSSAWHKCIFILYATPG